MATKKKTATTKKVDNGARLPQSAIPEVAKFLSVKEELDALKVDNADLFRDYADLVDQYNTALEAADMAVRLKEVSCGPFENFSSKTEYNAEAMYEELGEPLFLKCGGSMTKKTIYTVDSNRVEAAIASGAIPDECVPEFSKIARKYHAPKKIAT